MIKHRIGIGIGCILLALACAAKAQPATAAHAEEVKKLPAPAADELKEATKLVDDIYKGEIAAAKTAEQKAGILPNILKAAQEEKNGANLYALLNRARELAIEVGSVDAAGQLILKLDEHFEIDSVKLTADTIVGLQKTTRQPDELRRLAALATAGSDSAIEEDRYDLARQMSDAAMSCARLLADAGLLKELTVKAQRVYELDTGFVEAKKALAILNDKPTDADANLKVGKFFCLLKGNWDKGLPMLALGNDEPLKAAATLDLKGAVDADEQIKIGDNWWDLAEKLPAAQQFRMRVRAESWYQTALPTLTGLSKARIEKRLTTIETDRQKYVGTRVINLIAATPGKLNGLVVSGQWVLKNNVLTSNTESPATLQFAYHPPEEYDYRVDFARIEGGDSMVIILTTGKKNFVWQIGGWRNTAVGFENINGKRSSENPTTLKGGIETGKKYEAVVKVRKTGLEAYMNGKLVTTFKTDYSNVDESAYFQIRDKAAVGLASWGSSCVVTRAEVLEVSGRGAAVTTGPAK